MRLGGHQPVGDLAAPRAAHRRSVAWHHEAGLTLHARHMQIDVGPGLPIEPVDVLAGRACHRGGALGARHDGGALWALASDDDVCDVAVLALLPKRKSQGGVQWVRGAGWGRYQSLCCHRAYRWLVAPAAAYADVGGLGCGPGGGGRIDATALGTRYLQSTCQGQPVEAGRDGTAPSRRLAGGT